MRVLAFGHNHHDWNLRKPKTAPPSDDPVVQDAVQVLRGWDFQTGVENRAAALAVLTMEPIIRARIFGDQVPDLMKTLTERAHLLKEKYGRVDPPWGDVNRLRRGSIDVGLCGGPDVLHAVYGSLQDGHLIGNAGDCYVLIASWDKDGKVSSRAVHQFGSATLDEKSPHYADQVPLFVACKTRPVWLDEAEIRQHLEREYRPGEDHAAKEAK